LSQQVPGAQQGMKHSFGYGRSRVGGRLRYFYHADRKIP
jgi:hypothetical protein